MTAPVVTTWGFWVGLWIGMISGCFVFGVAIIGQGVFESGRMWGEIQCKAEAGQ